MNMTKKNTAIFITAFTIAVLSSCNGDDQKYTKWADTVESKTLLIKPEGWDDEYWNSVNVNVDKDKIFNTLLAGVLEGKLEAFDIITDLQLSIDEVKALVVNMQLNEAGMLESQTVTKDDLSTIRMRESWSFDETNFKLKKEVTRIDFLLKKLNVDGEYVGDKALFYVNLK